MLTYFESLRYKVQIEHLNNYHYNSFIEFSIIAFLGLLVAIFMQTGVNYANDYYDNQHEIFAKTRPIISLVSAKRRMIGSFILACLSGIILLAIAPLPLVAKIILLLSGGICIIVAINYSGGINYAAKSGLADIISGLFFGPISMCLLFFTLTYVDDIHIWQWSAMLHILPKSLSLGIVISGMLMLDNIRDIESDPQKGKHTLQSKIGLGKSILLYKISIIFASIIALLFFTPYLVSIALVIFLLVVLINQQNNLKEMNIERAFKFNVLIGFVLTLLMVF